MTLLLFSFSSSPPPHPSLFIYDLVIIRIFSLLIFLFPSSFRSHLFRLVHRPVLCGESLTWEVFSLAYTRHETRGGNRCNILSDLVDHVESSRRHQHRKADWDISLRYLVLKKYWTPKNPPRLSQFMLYFNTHQNQEQIHHQALH